MLKIQKIRQGVREQNYRITIHAQREANEDNLDKEDVETILLTGKITKKFTHDPRGIRYLITGKTRDGRNACVVCRFLEIKKLSIITVYVKGE